MSNQAFDGVDFVEIVYRGYVGMHMVLSPRRFFSSYGLHTYGDRFRVHIEDQKAAPILFELLPVVDAVAIAEPAAVAEAPAPVSEEVPAPVSEEVPVPVVEVTPEVSPTEAPQE